MLCKSDAVAAWYSPMHAWYSPCMRGTPNDSDSLEMTFRLAVTGLAVLDCRMANQRAVNLQVFFFSFFFLGIFNHFTLKNSHFYPASHRPSACRMPRVQNANT